jgi:superfamily I DNA and/or RNA helicase
LSGPRRDDVLDRLLDPEQPVVLLIVDHRGCHQQSELEVEIVTDLAYQLMVEHGLRADQLALISPHRAQNNATADRLSKLLGGRDVTLPLIDTVERVQGAERDVILFALTTSDPDNVESEFLNNPNRFNVAITRARQKLIVVGSRTFFSTIPHTEKALKANSCFKAFFEFCRGKDSLFFWERG